MTPNAKPPAPDTAAVRACDRCGKRPVKARLLLKVEVGGAWTQAWNLCVGCTARLSCSGFELEMARRYADRGDTRIAAALAEVARADSELEAAMVTRREASAKILDDRLEKRRQESRSRPGDGRRDPRQEPEGDGRVTGPGRLGRERPGDRHSLHWAATQGRG